MKTNKQKTNMPAHGHVLFLKNKRENVDGITQSFQTIEGLWILFLIDQETRNLILYMESEADFL